MENELIIGGLSFLGTVIGTLGGILAANKLTNYRIGELEKKVDKHNNLIERMYELERKQDVLEQALKVEQHRMGDAEEDIKKINERMTRRNAI